MLRISELLKEVQNPSPVKPWRRLPGPMVIWNLVRRCNLTCQHCYALSANKDFDNELSTPQIFAVMDDLKQMGVPALILSGGEPLLHPDIFTIAARAKAMRFYVALSTNGTLINETNIAQIAAAGFHYIGISLDGMEETHDHFRRKKGSFKASLNAIRLCRDHGLKVGIRYTLTEDNAHDFEPLLKLTEDEGISKFYFSHLNYAGRGNKHKDRAAHFEHVRRAVAHLFERAWQRLEKGMETAFVSGNNDADGVFLYFWVKERFGDSAAAHLLEKLKQWGGNASGINVANIDNEGRIHPDTMWWHETLGHVKQTPFSQVWQNLDNSLLKFLNERPRKVGGRCGQCQFLNICNGNSRVRAFQTTADYTAADPGCYLTDAEINNFPR